MECFEHYFSLNEIFIQSYLDLKVTKKNVWGDG